MSNASSRFVRVLIFALGFTVLEITSFDTFAPVEVVLSFFGGVLIALTLAWISSQTRLQKTALIIMVWVVLCVVEFSNVVEGYFFTTILSDPAVLGGSLLRSLLGTLVQAAMAGALFLPATHNGTLSSQLSSYFKQREFASWIWRIAVASAAYLPVYFFFGALISPYVIPYYSDPSLGLRIPSFTVILPLELFRGLLYAASLLSIFASVWVRRRTLLVMVASLLYIPGALVPLMLQYAIANRLQIISLPASILPFHLVEILADSIVYAAIATYLLARKR